MENTHVLQPDLITNDTDFNLQYNHATQGQRFLNFLIDNVLMRLTLTYGTGLLLARIFTAVFPGLMFRIFNENARIGLYILAFLIIIINYLVYYTLCEKLFRGQTIGKLFTGTRAIRYDGEELTFRDALLRSLCRLIPFEVFSGFGIPWHDSFTNTMVVSTR